jgi:predicted AAA+ superfamily ATPase
MLCLRVLANTNHAYLNFDDDQIARVQDSALLMRALGQVYPDTKLILFDEIQNYDNWELFASKLQRAGYNLILTGSNAHLLSGELASSLTGRHVSIELLPLSYREFLPLAAQRHTSPLKTSLTQYLYAGGFPEPLISGADPINYLRTLFDSILLKDIVQRYRLRNPRILSDLGYFLGNNLGALVSVEKLGKTLGIGSNATTQKLLGYLEQSYLFFLMQNYSHKVREQLRSPRKCYLIDSGLGSALNRTNAVRDARTLENAVFLDLLQRGSTLNRDCFYYRTRHGHEVDFMLRSSNQTTMLIQASYSLHDPGTRERELRALEEASKELRCTTCRIVTMSDREVISTKTAEIQVYPIEEWLTRKA